MTIQRSDTGRRAKALLPVLVVALGLLTVLVTPTAASAHAVLVSSSPQDGSRLANSPREVTLHFDEHVQLVPNTARVISTAGVRADTGRAHQPAADQSVVIIPLRAGLAKGGYTATWRVVSADTHIVSGSISFGIRQNARLAAAATPPPSSVDIASDASDGIVYLGIILGFGMLAMTTLLWPGLRNSRRTTSLVWAGWAMMLVGTAGELVLEGPRATASGWSGAIRLDGLATTLSSLYGAELLCRLALLALLIPFLSRRAAAHRHRLVLIAGGTLALLELIGVALGGHSGVGDDAWLAVPATVLHLAAMAVWLGGLATLFVVGLPTWRRREDAGDARLGRWSLIAFVSVATLIVTGEYQAFRQVQPLPSLWSTPYGITLLIKLTLVCAVLAAAFVAQRHIVHRKERGTTDLALLRLIRRSVWIESGLALLVVVATTVLVSEAPARTTYGPPVELTAPLGPDHVEIAVDGTLHGTVERVRVTPVDAAGHRVSVESIAGALSSADAGIASLNVPLKKTSTGWAGDVVVPLAGTWTLTLDIEIDQATGYATSASYRVW